MKRVFGVKKDKEPPPSIQDSSERINKRGDTVDEKIKKLDAELARYKEQIKNTRPGPAQVAVKARAMRVLKQKRMYEGQRDMLYNQTFNLDQVAFASEGIKDAQQTHLKGHGSSWWSNMCNPMGTCSLPHERYQL
uniref:Charged multivesicular body protein 5 n=1 Tax=Salix viminalis TaxID=40686 RepID=A0A6N2LRR0_SALVM